MRIAPRQRRLFRGTPLRGTLLRLIAVPLLSCCGLWLVAEEAVTLPQASLAFILLAMPWGAFLHWRSQGRKALELYPLVGGMLWVSYSLPFFLTRWIIQDPRLGEITLTESLVTQALELGVLGSFAVLVGTRIVILPRGMERSLPDIRSGPLPQAYIRSLLVAGLLVSGVGLGAVGAGGRQAAVILGGFVPLACLGLLQSQWIRGKARGVDKLLVIGAMLISSLVGLSSGWLAQATQVFVLLVAVYLGERKRIPVAIVAAGALVVLLLQPGKTSFRQQFWRGDREAGRLERARYWWGESADIWGRALSGGYGSSSKELATETLSRLSLIEPSARVLQLTPSPVPFQGLRMYTYLVAGWVPRFLWPSKPSINDANVFYQTAYLMSREEDLENASIACGFLPEGYIAFGWVGVVCVGMFVGVVLRLVEEVCWGAGAGNLARAVGAALVIRFLAVDGQLAQYLVGAAQAVFLTIFALTPVLDWNAWRLAARPAVRGRLASTSGRLAANSR